MEMKNIYRVDHEITKFLYGLILLHILIVTAAVSFASSFDQNGNQLPDNLSVPVLAEPKPSEFIGIGQARESIIEPSPCVTNGQTRGAQNPLASGVESRHADLPCKHGGLGKDGLMPSAHKLVQSNNSSGSSAPPSQTSARTPSVAPSTLTVFQEKRSAAELYNRLIDERYVPWKEPEILAGNSVKDRYSLTQFIR